MVRHQVKLFFIIAALAFTGCKKSAEDVQKDWNTTEQNAQKYSTKYPQAKAVIDDLTKSAKADFDAAKASTDKSKADKMKVAEEKLSGPLAIFPKYEASVAHLDGLLNDKTLMGSLSAADFKPLDAAAQAAKKKGCCILQPNDKACSDLQGTCATGVPAPANMGDLTNQLEGAIKDIDAAAAPLDAKKPKPAAPAGSAAGSAKAAPAGSAAPAPAGSAAGSAK